MKNYINLWIALILLVINGCEVLYDQEFENLKNEKYIIHEIPFASLYYHWDDINEYTDYTNITQCDSNGVYLFNYEGELYHHPLAIAMDILQAINTYEQVDELRYLEYSELAASTVINHGVYQENALYFPYSFDFKLFGYETEIMEAPWISGMTQGRFLSAICRLHHFTGNSEYDIIADEIIQSFYNYTNEFWIVFLTEDNFYWIAEYPQQEDPQMYTLNGFMFAIIGLYDYWYEFGGEDIEELLSWSLTTLKEYAPKFRVEGDISYYDLKYKVQSDRYHKHHIEELRYMTLITGDTFFDSLADLFLSDFDPY